ncbi:Adenosylcobinamide-phosphate synthase [hydrothermal vent metagenome]|uniref:Adenosylcobinamide-phosphate synthase n=1 Tax=hydrothermal vent metagenome TaxID=652676 RepID=A0A3B0QSF0_9ZZZZ
MGQVAEYILFFPVIAGGAYMLDLIFGDPVRLTHPVQWMGRLITGLERVLLRPNTTAATQRVMGALLVIITIALVAGVSAGLLLVCWGFSKVLFVVVSLYMAWTSLSVKSLSDEASAIGRSLAVGDGGRARLLLSRIVGRDTAALDKEGVLRATVESVSESTADGIVAPLFYLAIGGPVLAMVYKSVNTMDSMIGYRNDKYRYFGTFAARLDDVMGYLPARITAAFMIASAFILRFDWRGAASTLLADGQNHPSPNSGLSQAAVAGALGLRLAGPMSYKGVVHDKPFIGGGSRDASLTTLASTLKIMHLTGLITLALALTLQAVFILAVIA